MITGKTLIELGFRPGEWFKEAINHANEQHLQGEGLIQYLNSVCPPPPIEPFKEPKHYWKNIEAESELERSNVAHVFETMDELMKTPTVVSGAVMPDACPTGETGQIPVGGIAVTKNAIHPAMHSADICCSVMATSLGNVDPKKVLDTSQQITHFGGGGRMDPFELPKHIEEQIRGNFYLNDERSIQLSKTHLGTQGDGNHFLFVGLSENTGDTILVTHHGSRGFGANLYRKGKKVAERFRKELSPNTIKANAWIPFDEKEGKLYWDALQIVREWTKTNHSVIHNAICESIQADQDYRFWNEHNFVFKRDDLFYHAKGATPLSDSFVPDSFNGLRLVPLNMNAPILVMRGEETSNNLGFAPHGAGRNVSRTQHIKSKVGKGIQEIFLEETKGIDVRFFSGHIDISELPSAYKSAESVERQIKKFQLGTIVDRILPFGSIMAGDWEVDAPWKKRKRRSR